MSALPKPDFSAEYYAPSVQPKQTTNHYQEIVRQPLVSPAKVLKSRNFSQANTIPHRLQVLSLIQKGSFCLALASITASIGLYASTVKVPRLWSQEYANLEALQLQERQLVSINETFKYQIAKEAGEDQHLSISKPESALFIAPAEVKENTNSQLIANQKQVANLMHNNLGY